MDPNDEPERDPHRSISSGGSNGARYKLMSPAKLPISRSTCLMIPPGLSPTSFLESPVLLSNMKAEPSPTTGSFLNPQMMHLLSTRSGSNTNTFDERRSNSFEFRPHDVSKQSSVLPNVRPMISADINHQQSECFQGVGSQGQYQSYPSSPSIKNEVSVSSNDLNRSVPSQMAPPNDSTPAETNSIELDHRSNKGTAPSVATERSEDGYNWRKYGQKLVKGSEHPRSYYKCTHPNCEVKKLFERSYEGQITEIVYKGTHNHPKPQPSRRFNSGSVIPVQEETPDKALPLTWHDDESSNPYGQVARNLESNDALDLSPIGTNAEGVDAALQDEVDDENSFSKRRRMESGMLDITPIVKPIREPRVVVQTLSEVDILDDGYRWRKYGQKVVRGNPNPRSYYKCTNAGCPVRKHVERASHDPKAVITTYEGKHNHDVPVAKNSSHETPGSMAMNTMPRIRRDENDAISLDLGVGMSSGAEIRSNEQQFQTLQDGTNFNVLQSTPFSNYYGVSNQYGSRQIQMGP